MMADFKELERAYRESVEACVRDLQSSQSAQLGSGQPGFKESSQTYSISESGQELESAEAACLNFKVSEIQQLQPKIEFILRQMRQLTDETEEFDAYAERLMADIKTFIAPDHL